VTNKSTNPLIQNNFVLKKLEVGLERDEIDLNRIEIPARGDISFSLLAGEEAGMYGEALFEGPA
jgi:hypothetical protein